MKSHLRKGLCVVSAGALLTACYGGLKTVRHRRTYLATKRRCTKGPYEIRVRATGARWGERVRVFAHSPRRIGGRYSMRVNGEIVSRGWFGTPESPQNERCRQGGGGSARKSADGASESESGSPLRSAAREEIRAVENASRAAIEARERYVFPFYRIVGLATPPRYASCQTETLHPNELSAGDDVRVVIWSDRPDDMEGVIFEVRHDVFRPNVERREWLEEVRSQVASCRERRKARRVAARRLLRRDSRPSTKVEMCTEWKAISVGGRKVAHSVFLNGKRVGKRHRIRGGLTYRLPAKIRRPCVCWKHPQDDVCWGKHGRKSMERSFWKRARGRLKKSTLVAFSINRTSLKGDTIWSFERWIRYGYVLDLGDVACWGPGGYRAFRRRAIRQLRPAPKSLAPRRIERVPAPQ